MANAPRPTSPRQAKTGTEAEPEVFCSDEQSAVIIDLARWQQLAERVLAAEGIRAGTELCIIFVDELSIAELNSEFLGASGPTDVLSFPIDAADIEFRGGGTRGPDRAPGDPADVPLLLGDVVICPVVAERQAGQHAGTLDDELALLLIHGILHVLGHDHAEEDERAVMWARERELLEQLHWCAPAPSTFHHDGMDS